MDNDFYSFHQTEKILAFHCPRYDELPSIDLYMDQLIQFLSQILEKLDTQEKTPVFTSAMINNYVKMKVLRPPHKKQYGRHQIATLIIIYVCKNILTINEIMTLLSMNDPKYVDLQEKVYDQFCRTLEQSIRFVFLKQKKEITVQASSQIDQSDLIEAVCFAYANKLYTQALLQYQKTKAESLKDQTDVSEKGER